MSAVRNGKDGFIKIGNVVKKIHPSKYPHLIPLLYLPENLTATLTQHLQWILQKDVLGQDVFLIGPPGKTKRQLAMMYSELTQQEVEYISLSRDVTESDLKQRREIRNGTAIYANECAVRAALNGRLLVLEGLEKAERNVLPVLNNLLENREVQLEDGRFIMHPNRFDYLLGKHGPDVMEEWRLLRCSPEFRVLALGLPIPRYRGNPLDPPLRSRFQCRSVQPDTSESLVVGDRPPSDRALQLASFGLAVNAEEASSLSLPDFPADNLPAVMAMWQLAPSLPVEFCLQRLYPVAAVLPREAAQAVNGLSQKFNLNDKCDHTKQLAFKSCTLDNKNSSSSSSDNHTANVELRIGKDGLFAKQISLTVPCGSQQQQQQQHYELTAYHSGLLADLLITHSVSDFAVIGPRGCGKSALIGQLANLLHYRLVHIVLYKDMTSRDLLQQRVTNANGDTEWRHSPLVQAAVNGDLAVLDGLHRIDTGTFSLLQRLLQDRELSLFDSSRLIRHDRYDELQSRFGWSRDQMTANGLLRMHPSFRIVGIGELSQAKQQANQWLSSEMLTAFLYHPVRALSADEEYSLMLKLVPSAAESSTATAAVRQLVDFAHSLRNSSDASHTALAGNLSTRQLLRLTRCTAAAGIEAGAAELRQLVENACLSRFLPRLAAQSLSQCLDEAGFKTDPIDQSEAAHIDCKVDGDRLVIGSSAIDLPKELRNEMKIPDTLFYDNQAHLRVMESMLRDFSLGEHLLLIGNQGVGKNKVVDQFLKLMRRPREYIQLHRDTTVHTLTQQPTVIDGVIKYKDSPLVRACKLGHVLVVDEADKAPTHVTCVLKSLAETGEMLLADGRRILPAAAAAAGEGDICTHRDFRLIVLANRPGFPFLGNDFFGALGDTFACHPVDNPMFESEMEMLRSYGPDVPKHLLQKLVQVFTELRALADEGSIQYPYSTRELVNVVRHLQKYPDERLATVLQNVFDFDSHNTELRSTLSAVMVRHGIPADSVRHDSTQLSKQLQLGAITEVGTTNLIRAPSDNGQQQLLASESDIEFRGPATLPSAAAKLQAANARAQFFTELESFVVVPLDDSDAVSDICVTEGPSDQPQAVSHVATLSPLRIHSVPVGSSKATVLDLSDLFPDTGSAIYKPRVQLLSMGQAMPHHFLYFEQRANVLLLINSSTNEATRLKTRKLIEQPLGGAGGRHIWSRSAGSADAGEVGFRLVDSLAAGTAAVLFQLKRPQIEILDFATGTALSLQLPNPIANLLAVGERSWLVQFSDSRLPCLLQQSESNSSEFQLLQQETPLLPEHIHWSCELAAAEESSSSSSSSSLLLHPSCHAALLSIEPENAEGLQQMRIRQFPLLLPSATAAAAAAGSDVEDGEGQQQSRNNNNNRSISLNSRFSQSCTMQQGQLLVRSRSMAEVPANALLNPNPSSDALLEVTDLQQGTVRYMPLLAPIAIESGRSLNRYTAWALAGLPSLLVAPANQDLLSIDQTGRLCLWQAAPARIDSAMAEWQRLVGAGSGVGDGEARRSLMIERQLPGGANGLAGPKHGKQDPTGAPHVGGNTWAGGSGGRDTAGLGGVGGPYRLDGGHDVYQVPDEVKQAVPREVTEAAREMAKKAWRERLRDIEMSEHDGELYETYMRRVRPQISSLRAVLQSLEAKGKERSWLRHQTQGDLDDGKLIEGLVGERAVYRRRGERPPELGSPPEKPKVLRVLVDVSGSMYRFNGHDHRLERQLEACLMLMESLEGFETKMKYEFRGHSGEGPNWPFTSSTKPPANQKERLDALKGMLAHAQFCLSGDHTIEAIECGVRQLAEQEADERFLVVFSDANLDRYGIHPRHLGRALTQDPKVTACAIFIGSLGDQAATLRKSLPSGHAFVCLDNTNLPLILQQFFTSTLLASD